jgi:hypothetical protein
MTAMSWRGLRCPGEPPRELTLCPTRGLASPVHRHVVEARGSRRFLRLALQPVSLQGPSASFASPSPELRSWLRAPGEARSPPRDSPPHRLYAIPTFASWQLVLPGSLSSWSRPPRRPRPHDAFRLTSPCALRERASRARSSRPAVDARRSSDHHRPSEGRSRGDRLTSHSHSLRLT